MAISEATNFLDLDAELDKTAVPGPVGNEVTGSGEQPKSTNPFSPVDGGEKKLSNEHVRERGGGGGGFGGWGGEGWEGEGGIGGGEVRDGRGREGLGVGR